MIVEVKVASQRLFSWYNYFHTHIQG